MYCKAGNRADCAARSRYNMDASEYGAYTADCLQLVNNISTMLPQTTLIGVRLRAVAAFASQGGARAQLTLVLAMNMFMLNGCLNGVLPEDRGLMDELLLAASQIIRSEGKGSTPGSRVAIHQS